MITLGVADLMMSANGVLFWDVRFVRGVHAWDLEAMSDFMVNIYGSPIRGRGEDKMCWIPSKIKGFLVSDYYRILAGSAFFGFPWKSIWKQKIPSSVAFFVWTAALGKCLMIDNLRKRKVWILDWCYMCKRNGESVDHLFLYCPFASDLWSMVYGFGPFWSFLGYAALCFGVVMVLARQLWSSSKWLYLVHHSSLLIVVSLEGEE